MTGGLVSRPSLKCRQCGLHGTADVVLRAPRHLHRDPDHEPVVRHLDEPDRLRWLEDAVGQLGTGQVCSAISTMSVA
jgi:hypothetical protein